MRIVFALIAVLTGFQAGDAAKPWEVPYQIEGVWKMTDESGDLGRVKIFVRNDTLYGVIQDIFGVPRGQTAACSNCSDSLKGKPLIGMTILKDFIQSDRIWKKGRMLDYREGKFYKAELEISPDESTLNVFSYVRFILKVGRTQKWVKEQ